MPLTLTVVAEGHNNIPATVAVAIAGSCITRSDEQRHIAFVAQRDEAWYLIHLAWENAFLIQPTTDPSARAFAYCFTPLTLLDEVNRDVFVEWLFTLHMQTGGRVPYSIDPPDIQTRFEATTGAMKPFGDGEGFTCASFVKCTLEQYGYRLLDDSPENWPIRESDVLWQTCIVERLKGTATDESIAAQQALIGNVARFRPEEILGAAYALGETPLAQRVPLSLAQAEPIGQQAVTELRRLGRG
ncbi:hypothetical protein DOT66_25080 [Ralstonia pseudosolanacearum]|uniref:hypothetical protein n=1 Tax=Ralstonia pseudosolanacearum TaxID=1310165 RepID=UPI000DAF11D2|nr:hypothetical protein [Ralstonia pseudosolanacearum]QWQ11216.1 hypothetical protein KN198_13070 [Ralstonia solanacearum]RAA04487.1 hypothetical protein DOT66_25080 [Ralstonia pseudosolanacearum]